ncbi:MAG: trigger factor family protein [bacterium]|nr:trigger factor family protein [bacterium]
MDKQLERLDNGNIVLTIDLPWIEVLAAYEDVVNEQVAQAEIKGFRKGMAPRKLVEEKLDRNQTMSHAMEHLLPKKYQAAIDAHGLKPVIYPRIHIPKGNEGEDWQFVATLCEAPVVKLGPIVHLKDQKLADIVEKLVKSSEIKLADMLIEAESDHRLAALADNLTKLGLTVDKYLQTKKLTTEELRARLAAEARRDLEVEFVLQQIQVEHKLADRQKTLDFLTSNI